MPIWWGRMETGKRLDARPDAIEIFGDAYQSITNAVELKEPVSRCFGRFCKYLCDVWRWHRIFGSVSIWCIDMWWNIWRWWACMCQNDAKDVRRSANSYTAVGNAYGAKCKNIRKFRRNIRILRTYGGRTSARLSTNPKTVLCGLQCDMLLDYNSPRMHQWHPGQLWSPAWRLWVHSGDN